MAGEYGRRRKALSRAGRSPQLEPEAESGRRRSTSDQALRCHSSIWRSSLTRLHTRPPRRPSALRSPPTTAHVVVSRAGCCASPFGKTTALKLVCQRTHGALPPTSTDLEDPLANQTRSIMAARAPRPLSWFLPAMIVPVAAGLIAHPLLVHTPHSFPALEISTGFSLLAFVGCLYVVPALGPAFVAKGLSGRDMLKLSDAQVCVSPPLPPSR
jgi:hypothetical protein